jgi:hypothetical protein
MRISNSISELRQQIYHDLRIQHPDWVELNDECPMCDSYVARDCLRVRGRADADERIRTREQQCHEKEDRWWKQFKELLLERGG